MPMCRYTLCIDIPTYRHPINGYTLLMDIPYMWAYLHIDIPYMETFGAVFLVLNTCS